MNPFSRPPSRPGTGTGTSEPASFHSIDNRSESEPEPIDINETTVPYEIELETETQLPDPEPKFDLEPEPESESEIEPEPTIAMANTTMAPPAMEVDHEGKSYLKKPEPFNGNRRKVNDFIYACDLFFEGSFDKDFPNDKQKIIFILSYMSEGKAQRWKKNYIKMTIRQADGSYTWPTKAVFLAAFKAAFLNEDKKEESIWKLNYINQGNKTAEEYVNKFQLTVSKVGLSTNNDMIIRTFRKGLNKALATRIMYSNKKPNALEDTTLKKGWYTIAIEFDRVHWDNVQALNEWSDKPMGWQQTLPNQFRQAYGRGYQSGPAYQQGNNQGNYQSQYDPNAMDVNVITMALNTMSYEEQGKYLKKGLCFNCKQPGHVSHNCPKLKNTGYSNNRTSNQWNDNRTFAPWSNNQTFTPRNNNPFWNMNAIKKPGPQEINKMIHALTIEERDEMFAIPEADEEEKGPNEKDFS